MGLLVFWEKCQVNDFSKRLMDVLLAVAGLILTAPVMLSIVLLLRIEEPGNPFFSQERSGKHGKPFHIHKFRKFPTSWGASGPGVTVAGDARMTPVGALLERTKMDELPQFWNILKGEMSFVGPRPESLRYADLFQGEFAEVLDFVPGIFGPNQIEFRNESAMYPADEDPEVFYRRELFPRKARNDIRYFRNANFLSDLVWIFRGVQVSLIGVIDWHRFMGLHAKILLVDYVLILLAWSVAYFIRFPYVFSFQIYPEFRSGLLAIPPMVIAGMSLGGCYRNPVRYFSFCDAKRLLEVAVISWSLVFIVLMGFLSRSTSLLLWPLGGGFIVGFLVLPSLMMRIKWEKEHWSMLEEKCKSRLLIYGGGKRGGAFANWVTYGTRQLQMKGFIDDDPALRGNKVFGFPVYGRQSDIPTIASVHGITEIWTSFMPDVIKRSKLEAVCKECSIRLVILPELEPFCRYSEYIAPMPEKNNIERLDDRRTKITRRLA